jgi:hypothetical protein
MSGGNEKPAADQQANTCSPIHCIRHREVSVRPLIAFGPVVCVLSS